MIPEFGNPLLQVYIQCGGDGALFDLAPSYDRPPNRHKGDIVVISPSTMLSLPKDFWQYSPTFPLNENQQKKIESIPLLRKIAKSSQKLAKELNIDFPLGLRGRNTQHMAARLFWYGGLVSERFRFLEDFGDLGKTDWDIFLDPKIYSQICQEFGIVSNSSRVYENWQYAQVKSKGSELDIATIIDPRMDNVLQSLCYYGGLPNDRAAICLTNYGRWAIYNPFNMIGKYNPDDITDHSNSLRNLLELGEPLGDHPYFTLRNRMRQIMLWPAAHWGEIGPIFPSRNPNKAEAVAFIAQFRKQIKIYEKFDEDKYTSSKFAQKALVMHRIDSIIRLCARVAGDSEVTKQLDSFLIDAYAKFEEFPFNIRKSRRKNITRLPALYESHASDPRTFSTTTQVRFFA